MCAICKEYPVRQSQKYSSGSKYIAGLNQKQTYSLQNVQCPHI